MNADYLELTDLTVSFDGFVAVDSVNLSVLPGSSSDPTAPARPR
jgi:urea transport system ATP-binding protein